MALLSLCGHRFAGLFLRVEAAKKRLKFGNGGQSADLKKSGSGGKADHPRTGFLVQPIHARLAHGRFLGLSAASEPTVARHQRPKTRTQVRAARVGLQAWSGQPWVTAT